MDKPNWLEVALTERGVHETPGIAATDRIVEYASHTTLEATSDEVPWCSSFANFCIDQAGLKGTRSAAARSWLQWGKKLDEPQQGCIVVFKRGNDPASGHVAFYLETVGDRIVALGGNQGDQVKVSSFKKTDVLGYRWPA